LFLLKKNNFVLSVSLTAYIQNGPNKITVDWDHFYFGPIWFCQSGTWVSGLFWFDQSSLQMKNGMEELSDCYHGSQTRHDPTDGKLDLSF
jgi:hypothetical protein